MKRRSLLKSLFASPLAVLCGKATLGKEIIPPQSITRTLYGSLENGKVVWRGPSSVVPGDLKVSFVAG